MQKTEIYIILIFNLNLYYFYYIHQQIGDCWQEDKQQ